MSKNSGPSAQGQLWLLSLAYALAFTPAAVAVTSGSLIGREIAPSPTLATLPISIQIIAMMLAGIPASWLMTKIGRKRGFQIGLAIGAIGGLLALNAANGFVFLLLASFCIGTMLGFSQLLRFAATDLFPSNPSKAVGTVLLGGIMAAAVGPALAVWAKDWTGTPFAASYGLATVLTLLSAVVVQSVRFAPTKVATSSSSTSQLLFQTPVLVGIGAAMLGYGTMSLVMTATPLAMVDTGHSVLTTSRVISAHGLAMFIPSFFTGKWLQRFGYGKIMAVSWLMLLATCGLLLWSTSFVAFLAGLILLGLGWNGMFVGGTSMVAKHTEGGGLMVQGINDLLVLGAAAAGSLLSGVAIALIGWDNMQIWLMALLGLGGLALLMSGLRIIQPASPTVGSS